MVNLTREDKRKIAAAIVEAEKLTSAEIAVHIRAFCLGDPLKAAQSVFDRLGMRRTRARNAVLIYVGLSTRKFAIYGDKAIHEKAGDAFWNRTRDDMRAAFAAGPLEGILAGVRAAGRELSRHFPAGADNPDELPDRPTQD